MALFLEDDVSLAIYNSLKKLRVFYWDNMVSCIPHIPCQHRNLLSPTRP